jgi:hypothetical protein
MFRLFETELSMPTWCEFVVCFKLRFAFKISGAVKVKF